MGFFFERSKILKTRQGFWGPEFDFSIPKSNLTAMSKPLENNMLSKARVFIDWDSADTMARKWWSSVERLNSKKKLLVLKLAYELKKRQIDLETIFQVWLHSGIQDLGALLRHLDCLRQDKDSQPFNLSNKQTIPGKLAGVEADSITSRKGLRPNNNTWLH